MNPDCPTTEARSKVMRAVKSRDTGPERLLRSLLHRRGLRFRKHRSEDGLSLLGRLPLNQGFERVGRNPHIL